LEAEFEIEPGPHGVKLRYPATERAQLISNALAKFIQETSGQNVEPKPIELSGVKDPEVRTKFFTTMIGAIRGYSLKDVKSVSVDRGGVPVALESESEAEDDEGQIGDRSQAREEEEYAGEVRKAILRGNGLLYAEEYQALTRKRFYISKVIWQSKKDAPDGHLVEFEASFGDPIEAKHFRYQVRGIWRAKADGNLRKAGEAPKAAEKRELLMLLEQAATSALAAIPVGTSDSPEGTS
jgi:hypothetical protein